MGLARLLGRRRKPPVYDPEPDLALIETELAGLLSEVGLLVDLALRPRTPVRITLTATSSGRTPSSVSNQFPEGHPIAITADVENAEHVPVPDTLTWTATSGTVAVDDTTLKATLTGAALGEVTVTATDSGGLTGSLTLEVVDPTPAFINLSAAAV